MDLVRSAGLLLHISSLPGNYGIGTLGQEAYDFADRLVAGGQQYWQILPFGPVSAIFEYSPYASRSAFAGNDLLISLNKLKEKWFALDIAPFTGKEADFISFEKVVQHKRPILEQGVEIFFADDAGEEWKAYELFCKTAKHWLDDFALFAALADHFKTDYWPSWDRAAAFREPEALDRWRERLNRKIDYYKVIQYIFYDQLETLKQYCNRLGIKIIGDIPIYIPFESADVWAHPDIFQLDKKSGRPTAVSGVPPDYFSETGQRWGNPLYRWQDQSGTLNKVTMDWWCRRIQHLNQYVDIIRIDHFRALESYWSIPAAEKTAVRGKWVAGPGIEFFRVLKKRLGVLPLIAEDLGEITPDVEKLRDAVFLPGMKILQFAFDFNHQNPYLPHNYKNRNTIVYTGTHDNNTTNGWFYGTEVDEDRRKYILDYMDSTNYSDFHWQLIKMAYASVADLAIVPVQDILGFGEPFRMNRPGTMGNNWKWKLKHAHLSDALMMKLKHEVDLYGRSAVDPTQTG